MDNPMTDTNDIEHCAIKSAAGQLIAFMVPAVATLPNSIRASTLNWVFLEMLAREIGPVATVEHLRLLADICERVGIDKLGTPGRMN